MEKYLEEHIEYIKGFLFKNGFEQDPDNINIVKNDKCEITIYANYYDIHGYFSEIEDFGSVSSKDLNIYWLIGILTYDSFMDKNYII